MKILVLNCGSSSIKYQLIDMANNAEVMAKGLLERIGLEMGEFTHKYHGEKHYEQLPIPDHTAGIKIVLKALVERGKYNQLADNLNRLSRKHKKSPLPIIEIVEQLEELKVRYSHPDKETPTQTSAGITADIVLSETFFCYPLIS